MKQILVDDIDALPGESLVVWVITHNTADYGDKYVVRRQVPTSYELFVERSCTVCDTLEQARSKIPSGTECMTRDPDDDPVIVESWI